MSERSPNDPRCRYEEIHKILAKIIELVKPETDLTMLEKVIFAWYTKNSICKRTTNKDRCETAWVLYHNRVMSVSIKSMSLQDARKTLENPEELV